jgi:cytochrome c oxidase assembly protein subunit 11
MYGKQANRQQANRKLTAKLLLATAAMFGFGYALVPLYDVMCDVLGINGKTSEIAAKAPDGQLPDYGRSIDVEFMAHIPNGMQWKLEPMQQRITVHPGQVVRTAYKATNLSGQNMTGQAVPSVAPGQAASYFNKIECFCFTRQPLQAGESAELGLIFFVERTIPDTVHTLTLSYTLYDVTESTPQQIALSGSADLVSNPLRSAQ